MFVLADLNGFQLFDLTFIMNNSDARDRAGALLIKRRVANRLCNDEQKPHHCGGCFLHLIPTALAPTVGMTREVSPLTLGHIQKCFLINP